MTLKLYLIGLLLAGIGQMHGMPISMADNSEHLLFNGKTLEGWETTSGQPVTAGWEARDGTLFRAHRSGPIYAVGEYGDFDLKFEWKLARGGNSGVKYRVAFYEKGVHGNPNWLGCEYQIFDDEGRTASPKRSTGALYALYAPNDKKKLNPIGQFNRSRIVVQGTKIEHWLNGERIVKVDTSSEDWRKRIANSKFAPVKDFFRNKTGRLQLQDHGHDVWFKNITLRELN